MKEVLAGCVLSITSAAITISQPETNNKQPSTLMRTPFQDNLDGKNEMPQVYLGRSRFGELIRRITDTILNNP